MDAQRVPWNYTLPNGNVAITMDACFQMLRDQGITPVPEPEDGSLWCNATYDTVLCWPPTPANTSIVLPCPPLKGLDPTRNIVKSCDRFGRWAGKSEGVYENPWGWTNFTVCFKMDYENVKEISRRNVIGLENGMAVPKTTLPENMAGRTSRCAIRTK